MLAEGKPPKDVLRGVRGMSGDIISSTFQVMGEQIRGVLGSAKEFMKMFGEFQRLSIERWMQSHDSSLITGRISPEGLRRTVYNVISEHADSFFSGGSVMKKMWQRIRETLSRGDEGFMPPMNQVRDNMGDEFDKLREHLINKSKRIYP